VALPVWWVLPWVGVLAFLLFVARLPRELPPARAATAASGPTPRVSVIVPARNEAPNIEACVRSLIASTYPAFEVVVVDDRSEDGTGALARSLGGGTADRVVVVDGTELPDGWLGKPWACHQGAAHATGELLLFTDADTRHAPELLARAVAGLDEERADLLTVVGRQLMETFWERIVQPQIFMLMLFRFPRFERTARSAPWREAIANGQYMLFRREAYHAIGGHEAVRGEVVEDLVLAQRVKRAGLRLRIRGAQAELATRMYRSLPQLVEGWSKNIVLGGLRSLPPWLRPLMPALSLAAGIALWIAPPLALLAGVLGVGSAALLVWSAAVCTVSAATWALFSRQMGIPAGYGLLYPVGAAVGSYIFVRSWARGGHVVWKGRSYQLPSIWEEA
jgi:chlorobactene glucosyltransferase